MTTPFHFPSLVWGESIAIYLFLLGISAGSTMMVILLKRSGLIGGEVSQNYLIKINAFLAPITVICGLTLLIFHLARPWTFWKLMFHYSHTSIMSCGVMLFQGYFITLTLWLLNIYQNQVKYLIQQRFPSLMTFTNFAYRIIGYIQGIVEFLLLLIAIALGAYTGFLLSALISYPMLNNPVLPVLFLASGMSSGIASLTLCALFFTKTNPQDPQLVWLHKIERFVLLTELFLLFAYFFGLYLGGGQKTLSFYTALGHGFWAQVFWIGVVFIGILLPLGLNQFSKPSLRHRKSFVYLVAGSTLFGVLCLRFFILYAGQMTLA